MANSYGRKWIDRVGYAFFILPRYFFAKREIRGSKQANGAVLLQSTCRGKLSKNVEGYFCNQNGAIKAFTCVFGFRANLCLWRLSYGTLLV